MANLNKHFQSGLIALIQLYRFAISSLLGHCCRFEPSCSQYAIEAIQEQGVLKGLYLMVRRVLRCHPWHAGGFDPVPHACRDKSIQNIPSTNQK